MTEKEKVQKIKVAYTALKDVLEDTDESDWDYYFMEQSVVSIERMFDEGELFY